MKIGLWNIDHPENDIKRNNRHKRFLGVIDYLQEQNCELLILCESNSAIKLSGYTPYFSDESPFRNKNRCYGHPNRYYQVSIFSKIPTEQIDISEPINGLLCKIEHQKRHVFIYGNVITIKDQWKKDSDIKYKDRLQEQISQFNQLLGKDFIIGGDFNLKKGWAQKKAAFDQVNSFVTNNNLQWPTARQTTSVQHVIHSPSINTKIKIDCSVQHKNGKKNSLSDHPFFEITIM
jgi:hypothetical protein